MRVEIKRSTVYNEFDDYEKKYFFDCKEDKVINNVDTFYYSVFLENDWNGSSKINLLLDDLEHYRCMIEKSNEKSLQFKESEFFIVKRGFSIYKYCLSIENYVDVFFSNYLPNSDTPRVVVQLRSISLWTKSPEYCVLDSYNSLAMLLNSYGINIIATRENRIDYAYHTNSIQNPLNFFSDANLEKYCFTKYKIYTKMGRITPGKITVDYFALGRRSSNNVFVRMYNKSREVVELAYKEMFFDIWFSHGLISRYDKFIYEFCFNSKSFEQKNIAMLQWYIEFGKNDSTKFYFKDLLVKYSDSPKKLDSIVTQYFPSLTLIHNIEFQTKRKFYSTCDRMISILPVFSQNNFSTLPITRLYQILDNRKLFLEYLTCESVRFVKDSTCKVDFASGAVPEYQRWWKVIRESKLTKYGDLKLTREYVKKLNIDKLKKEIVSKISTFSLYTNNFNSNSFQEDLSDFLSYFNDNDMEKSKLLFLEESTGEVLSLFEDEYYQLKKQQKYKSLKPLIDSDSQSLSNHSV